MPTKRLSLFFWMLGFAFLLATVGVVATVLIPERTEKFSTVAPAKVPQTLANQNDPSDQIGMSQFLPFLDKKMRQPWVDAPPAIAPTKVVATPTPKPVDFNLALVATFVQPGNAEAVLKDTKGRIHFGSVGSSLGPPMDVEIVEVERGAIVVRYLGRLHQLSTSVEKTSKTEKVSQ